MTKLFNVALGAAIVAGALLLTTANVGKASAADGTTTLSGAACVTQPSVTAYNIDYGTFLASDVYGQAKNNAGTKGGSTYTPTFDGGDAGAGYFVYVSNPCPDDVSWTVTVSATNMSGSITGTSISGGAQFFSGNSTLYRFDNSPANTTVTATNGTAQTSLGSATTVITKTSENNGLGGNFGRKFGHNIQIPQSQAVTYYAGTFTVTCVSC